MEKIYKNCQSCGMPLSKSRGTDADGTPSTMFCGKCYEHGQFTQPNITAKEMQEISKTKMKEMGFPSFMAWAFSRNVPKLARWKK